MKGKKRQSYDSSPPWGKADEHRGLLWHPDAVAFAQEHPKRPVKFAVGTFDKFAESRGVYTVPQGVSRASPEWSMLLQHRRKFKAHLNLASAHQRMLVQEGIEPFYLLVVTPGVTWEARPTGEAYKDERLLHPIRKAFDAPERHIRHCLQSATWNPDEPWQAEYAVTYFQDLMDQKEDYIHGYAKLQAKFTDLERRLRLHTRKQLPPKERQ